jgi:DNA polymerase-3 subunit gamma/tau
VEGYQVIARRWRPQGFRELVGQEHIVRTLTNAIERERLAHAYLFVGPRGTGKTSTARLLACALNAGDRPAVDFSPTDERTRQIMEGRCMDVIEIDGASNNSVEQVRDLREDCQYSPSQCPFKIYIIDEVHMLSQAAFNALLKTLEEPPTHVKFIFATTESSKVLPTITSRCQRLEFRPIEDEVIANQLAAIARAEEIEIDEAALRAVAKLAAGGMRDAQSILDQLISFCGTSIGEEDVLEVFGLASEQELEDLAAAIATADYPALVAAADRLSKEGRDLPRTLGDLAGLFRSALLEAIRAGGTTSRFGPDLGTEPLLRILDALQESERSVQRGLNARVQFEIALLRAVDHARTRPIDTVLKELSSLAGDPPAEEKKNQPVSRLKSAAASEPPSRPKPTEPAETSPPAPARAAPPSPAEIPAPAGAAADPPPPPADPRSSVAPAAGPAAAADPSPPANASSPSPPANASADPVEFPTPSEEEPLDLAAEVARLEELPSAGDELDLLLRKLPEEMQHLLREEFRASFNGPVLFDPRKLSS